MKTSRHLAASLLVEIEGHRQTLDRLLEHYAGRIEKLDHRERALFHNLVYGVLRWQAKLDWILGSYSRKPLAKLDVGVRVALRLGLFQLLFLDRVPASAAVNTSVDIAKSLSGRWTGAYVNAILRNALRSKSGTAWPDPQKDPVAHLAAVQSMPAWLIRRWIGRFGFGATERLCQALNRVPPIVLRANRLKGDRRKIIQSLRPHVKQIEPSKAAPDGIVLRGPKCALSDLPGFEQGLFQVQAEASQLVAHLLRPAPQMKVWDACAGLGTKACQMAAMMQDKGQILASDKNRPRLEALDRETRRLGITSIKSRAIDLLAFSGNPFEDGFDRILLDAPCSALGVIQQNPDVKWSASRDKLAANAKRQLEMLRRVSGFLKPGGILVYAVCSFEPEETVEVIERFLKTNAKFDIYRPRDFPWLPSAITPAGFLQILPHEQAMSGFFAAALRHRT